MPTPQEQAEYEQYLRETGQAPAAPAPVTKPRTKEDMVRDALKQVDETDYGAAMNNALSMGGGTLAKAFPKLGGVIGGTLAKAFPKLGGVIGGALEGGITGAAQAPEGDRLAGFLKGGGTQGTIGAVGKALGKVGDIGMQMAVSRKKYTPGVGTKLADEGLWGTQRGMAKQVDAGLTDAYGDMLKAAETARPINSRQIGSQVYDDITGPYTGRGTIMPSSADAPRIMQAAEFADDIKSRGEIPAAQALKYRSAAGKRAYSEKTDAGRATPLGELSKKEQILYSDALKNADDTGKLRAADERYSALKRAERGLNEEAALPKSLMGAASFGVNKLPGGALATSTVGQAGVKGGKLAEFLAPKVRQAVVGGSRQPEPSAAELAEYEQYLRETGQK